MAHIVLVMGESGTGKSTSMRNCSPEEMAVVNPVGKPLPFRGHFTTLDKITEARKIIKFMQEQVAAGKKIIVIDDFQYILSVPYMNRIKEQGWDKWNDFGANYFDIIKGAEDLPEDVTVYFMTHTETLENGVTTIKLIGKLLREKITIEGLFTIVLRTGVNEGKYYFYTQNSGKDTVKSPLGMFPSYAIDNDLKYVDDKIRSYYEIGDHKTDEEMAKADASVAADLEKPDSKGRRGRTSRTRDEVKADNQKKVEEYMEKCNEEIDKAAGDKDSVSYDEAKKAMDKVENPELDKLPRNSRRSRTSESSMNTPEEPKEEPKTRSRRSRDIKPEGDTEKSVETAPEVKETEPNETPEDTTPRRRRRRA